MMMRKKFYTMLFGGTLTSMVVVLLLMSDSVTSIAAFAVSANMEKLGQDRRHLTTMSFNRSAFLIKTTAV